MLLGALVLTGSTVVIGSAAAATGGYPDDGALCRATGKRDGPCQNADFAYRQPNGSWGSVNSGRGYGYRNCTDFVAWKLGLPGGLGDATTWEARASRAGLVSSKTAAVGSVAWWASGHVAVVTAVNRDGSVAVEEYNQNPNSPGNYGTRSSVRATSYLLKKGQTPPPATQPASNDPIGSVDSIERGAGGIRVTGWALDPNSAESIAAHAYSGDGNPGGGNPGAAATANGPRPDVAAAHPGKGSAHGYDITVPARGVGTQTVCVYGINVGPGGNSRVGCKSIGVSQDPFGSLDGLRRVPGGLQALGWAIDPDSRDPIAVHAYSGTGAPGAGNPGAAVTADVVRPDVARIHPAYGDRHGYEVTVPARGAGRQTVCTYGINNGPGVNPQIGCRSIDVSPDPYGSLDEVRRVPGGVQVSGWAIDPDSADPIDVHVYGGTGGVGGGPGAGTRADIARPDIDGTFPGYGPRHGYSVFLPTGPQPQTVCAYGINNGPGVNPQIGCRTV